jgi:hypothetical protein
MQAATRTPPHFMPFIRRIAASGQGNRQQGEGNAQEAAPRLAGDKPEKPPKLRK